MNTDSLIRDLARQTPKVGPHAAAMRLMVGLLIGFAGAGLVLFIIKSFGGAETQAANEPVFLTKLAYSGSVAISAVLVASQLAAPESRPSRSYLIAFAPIAIMAMFAMAELMTAPPGSWMSMIFGYNVSSCLLTISLISPPIFLGLFWSFRKFAPSYPKSAGAAIGGLAGAAAAAVYAFASGDASTCFIFIWYTLAMATAAIAGLLLGPRLLHW